jgi:hypothetical protein
MTTTPAGSTPHRIGFIELPDQGLDLLTAYSRNPDWQIVLVVSLSPQSYAARMAEILRIPVIDTPNRPALSMCDRVVVGNNPSNLAETIREMVGSHPLEIQGLGEAAREAGLPLPAMDDEGPAVPALDLTHAWLNDDDVVRDPAAGPATGGASRPGGAARPGRIFRPRPSESVDVPRNALLTPEGHVPEAAERLFDMAPDAGATEILEEVLRAAVEAVGAPYGAVLIPEEDGRHLRVAVLHGVRDRLGLSWRERIGVGPAGEAFADGTARVHRARNTRPGEPAGDLDTAFVPVPGERGSTALLSVSVPASNDPAVRHRLGCLVPYAQAAAGVVIRALDLERLTGSLEREDLRGEIEQLMALSANLPDRLRAVGELLGRAFRADYTHVFLADTLSRRLNMVTEGGGLGATVPRQQSLDRGFLGWIVRRGAVQVLEASDPRTGERQAVLCLPIESSQPHGLILLENVPLLAQSSEDLARQLADLVAHLGDLIARGEGVEVRQLQSQLVLRVRDRIEEVTALADADRVEALLALAVESLAAEAAMWIPEKGTEPVVHPATAALLMDKEWDVNAVARWVREREMVAGGAFAPGWDVRAPRGPSPYVGVANLAGVLIAFFSPHEEAGSAAQLPPQVHFETLLQIADVLPNLAQEAA